MAENRITIEGDSNFLTNIDTNELMHDSPEKSEDSVDLHDEAGDFLKEYADFYAG